MDAFENGDRDSLRSIFQPSKIGLGVVEDTAAKRWNVLPLCFHMWCSYEPLLYAIAVDYRNYSAGLFQIASEYVLAIPGEGMLDTVVYCGTHSGRECDKGRECSIRWRPSQLVRPPGMVDSLANLELRISARYPTGDHVLIVGEIVSISLARGRKERPLLAVGPSTLGFDVLARHGIHTIGVPAGRP